MQAYALSTVADEQLELAGAANSGRSAVTVYGGREHDLRQTVIALTAGRRLGEHESPGEATLQVLRGQVRLHADGETWEGAAGDYLLIPPARHDLEAVTDCVVLLTVASRAG
jgi:quercetin dioxygenase-like cupin family protein